MLLNIFIELVIDHIRTACVCDEIFFKDSIFQVYGPKKNNIVIVLGKNEDTFGHFQLIRRG